MLPSPREGLELLALVPRPIVALLTSAFFLVSLTYVMFWLVVPPNLANFPIYFCFFLVLVTIASCRAAVAPWWPVSRDRTFPARPRTADC